MYLYLVLGEIKSRLTVLISGENAILLIKMYHVLLTHVLGISILRKNILVYANIFWDIDVRIFCAYIYN